jgi:23S rRNA pseudouridine1911/1915/1917 synthase
MSQESHRREFVADASSAGQRLDRFVAEHCPNLSRARVQELIDESLILLNGSRAKASHKLRVGERVYVEAQERPPLTAEPESIPLQILYEDDDVLVVNKPAGMSVHAGAGNSRGTLVNALLGRGQALSRGGAVTDDLRPGIVHRLDKETSGVIAIAKNDSAHAKLAEAFRTRAVKKTYIALAEGKFARDHGKIDLPIGRDPVRRTRMKALARPCSKSRGLAGRARKALTEWHALADLGPATLLEVQLHTGRTHQIRVHFSAIKHPLVGDVLYGAASHLRAGQAKMPALSRQFLHAAKLGFPHPRTAAWIEARAPLPADLRDYMDRLAAAEGRSLAAAKAYF